MIKPSIIPRLALLTVASAVLALLLSWVFQTFFSDVLPLATAEAIHPNWRFQGAYLVTILIYVSVAVAFMSLLGLIAMIGRRFLAEGKSNSS